MVNRLRCIHCTHLRNNSRPIALIIFETHDKTNQQGEHSPPVLCNFRKLSTLPFPSRLSSNYATVSGLALSRSAKTGKNRTNEIYRLKNVLTFRCAFERFNARLPY